MPPKVFIPRDIYKPFGIKPTDFTYWVKTGKVKADVQETLGQGAANVFSALQAIRAGFFQYFKVAGLTIEASEVFIDDLFLDPQWLYAMCRPEEAGFGLWLVAAGKTPVCCCRDDWDKIFDPIENTRLMLDSEEPWKLLCDETREPQEEKYMLPPLRNRDDFVSFTLNDGRTSLYVPKDAALAVMKQHGISFYNVTGIFQDAVKRLGVTVESDIEVPTKEMILNHIESEYDKAKELRKKKAPRA